MNIYDLNMYDTIIEILNNLKYKCNSLFTEK